MQAIHPPVITVNADQLTVNIFRDILLFLTVRITLHKTFCWNGTTVQNKTKTGNKETFFIAAK
jgi:hypothetical protein